MAPRGNINPRTVVAPLAAFTMACLLFTYTRSSIRTAREQAVSLNIFAMRLPYAVLTAQRSARNQGYGPRTPPKEDASRE